MTRRKTDKRSNTTLPTEATPTDEVSLIHKVEELNREVTRQRSVISVLTQRLSFMMSMFGIDDGVLTNSDATADSDSSVIDAKNGGPGDVVQASNSAMSAKDSFRGAVLSTVYVEQKQQESRAKNLVISGLPVGGPDDDKTVIERLCDKELNVQPSIRSCRRLGKRVEGRVQPVLVSLNSAAEASSVISKAKMLRQSADPLVKSHVYINPDLTKAQSAAAYELRCQRRKARDRMNQRSFAVPIAQPPSTPSEFKQSTGPASTLNTLASAFVPADTAST